MMQFGKITGALGAMALCACTTVVPEEVAAKQADEPQEREIGEDGVCLTEPAQKLVGLSASTDLGAKVLEATGATVLRWLPPGSVATMDYRQDRVSVHYDHAMVVTRISCG